MRQRRARGVERGQHVQRIHALPGLDVAVPIVSIGKAAGNVDERVEPAEMRRRGVDRRLGLRRVGQIDAAEFDSVRRSPGSARAHGRCRQPARRALRDLGDDLAKRTECARHDNDFSVHMLSIVTAPTSRRRIGLAMAAASRLGYNATLDR